MTAVANPPNLTTIPRPTWGLLSTNSSMDEAESRSMTAPRKQLLRSSSSSSASSSSSNSTIVINGAQVYSTPLPTPSDSSQWPSGGNNRKQRQHKALWPTGKSDAQADLSRLTVGRANNTLMPQSPMQPNGAQQVVQQRAGPGEQCLSQPVLYLASLNGTFERKTIAVPFAPDSLRIGRQTNQKTIPTPNNGFFDSKVLSRQHAEIYAERNGKIYIRDVKSSNGTFVNGTRLSQENRESDPHELQTADHLELGIDIVSEDQKTVVHHKVAAKVEHAGFLSNTNNVMDMNFGDLDPANGSIMVPNGSLQPRGRTGSGTPTAVGNHGSRMMSGGSPVAGMTQHRPFFLAPIATEQILKRLAVEIRSARLQSQDLSRTNEFVTALLSKDDVKDLERPRSSEPFKKLPLMNGGNFPFPADHRAHFSDPPAPPPQHPLPEKPDVAITKHNPQERPRLGGPTRQENVAQIIQLTEALNNARRDNDAQAARMRELESSLKRERAAREVAEDLARRLGESAKSHRMEKDERSLSTDDSNTDAPAAQADDGVKTDDLATSVQFQELEEIAASCQARADAAQEQLHEMCNQMKTWKDRCERAEAERDDGKRTLSEMVAHIRAEEALRAAAQSPNLPSSPGQLASRSESSDRVQQFDVRSKSTGASTAPTPQEQAPLSMKPLPDAPLAMTKLDKDEVSHKKDEIGPSDLPRRGRPDYSHCAQDGLPYASMLGVVLLGMGLMAYLNGWPNPSPQLGR